MATITLDPTTLQQVTQPTHNQNTVFIDRLLENTGISVVGDYDADTDRVYDVRGMLGFFNQIENPATGVSINVLLEKATRHPQNNEDSDPLEDADFTELVAEQTVSVGAFSTAFELVRATPEITFIRVRMKRVTGTTPIIVTGVTSAN